MKELKFKAEVEIVKPDGEVINANGILKLNFDSIPDDTKFEFLEDLQEYLMLTDINIEDKFLKFVAINVFNKGNGRLEETSKGYYVVIELSKADLWDNIIPYFADEDSVVGAKAVAKKMKERLSEEV